MSFLTLWDCGLNEDGANCRAKCFGMNGKKTQGELYAKKEKKRAGPVAALNSELASARVHSASINHRLLTGVTALSHQHAIV